MAEKKDLELNDEMLYKVNGGSTQQTAQFVENADITTVVSGLTASLYISGGSQSVTINSQGAVDNISLNGGSLCADDRGAVSKATGGSLNLL